MSSKRKYSQSLSFIEDGFIACYQNSIDLVGAAERLFEADYHAPGLSISVLALKEMGKICYIDGILFAKSEDFKTKNFGKSLKSHNHKLAAVPMIGSVAVMVARSDPRFDEIEIFRRSLAIGHQNWRRAGKELLELSGQNDFEFLDHWKQSGFYTRLTNGSNFQSPRDVVDRNISECVRNFARISSENIDFALSGGNIQRYIEQAQLIRSKLSEADHQLLEDSAEEMIEWMFEY
jgi:AbiV family abortive infection protein